MALTRAFLNGMGLTADQVSAIIEAHVETVDGLKAERDTYKDSADKLPKLEKQLEELKGVQTGTDEYKDKYEAEKKAFEDYKAEQSAKELTAKKSAQYQELLKEAGISEKRIPSIMKLADIDALVLDDTGKLKDKDTLTETVKQEWSDFIVETETNGAETVTPPAGESLGGDKPTVPAFF